MRVISKWVKLKVLLSKAIEIEEIYEMMCLRWGSAR